jgi:hypothetical protein
MGWGGSWACTSFTIAPFKWSDCHTWFLSELAAAHCCHCCSWAIDSLQLQGAGAPGIWHGLGGQLGLHVLYDCTV